MVEIISSSVLLISESEEYRMLLRAQLELMGLWGRIVEVETLAIAKQSTAIQRPELCIWHISDTYKDDISPDLKKQLGQHIIIIGNKQNTSIDCNEHFIQSPHTFHDLQDRIRATILPNHMSDAISRGKELAPGDQERIYRDLFDRGSDANLLLDYQTHIIIDANQRALQMYDITREEIIGMNMLELVTDSEHLNIYRDTQFLQTSQGEPVFVKRLDKKQDGTLMHVTVSGALFEFAGRMIFQDIIRDETDRKLAEEQEIQLRIEQERVKALRQFINDATHDLMTPITIIKTKLYLATKCKDETKRSQRIEVISNQVNRLQYMIEDMITIARLEALTPNEFDTIQVDLNQMIRTLVKNYQPILQKNNCTLTTHFPTERLHACINTEYFKLAITNLLDNTIQYTHNGGDIDISLEIDEKFIYLSVADNGIGIKEVDKPHIFEHFYRAERHRSDSGGAGLGLAIVKSIVELHNGYIEVISKQDVGSTFKIGLPRLDLT